MSNREYKLLVHADINSLIEETDNLQKDEWYKSAPKVRSGDDFLQIMHRYSRVSNETEEPIQSFTARQAKQLADLANENATDCLLADCLAKIKFCAEKGSYVTALPLPNLDRAKIIAKLTSAPYHYTVIDTSPKFVWISCAGGCR